MKIKRQWVRPYFVRFNIAWQILLQWRHVKTLYISGLSGSLLSGCPSIFIPFEGISVEEIQPHPLSLKYRPSLPLPYTHLPSVMVYIWIIWIYSDKQTNKLLQQNHAVIASVDLPSSHHSLSPALTCLLWWYISGLSGPLHQVTLISLFPLKPFEIIKPHPPLPIVTAIPSSPFTYLSPMVVYIWIIRVYSNCSSKISHCFCWVTLLHVHASSLD